MSSAWQQGVILGAEGEQVTRYTGEAEGGTERGREATSSKRGQDDWDVYTFFHREFSRAFDFFCCSFWEGNGVNEVPPLFSNTCDTVIYHYLLLRLHHLLHPFSHSWFFAFCCDLSVVERGREGRKRGTGNGDYGYGIIMAFYQVLAG